MGSFGGQSSCAQSIMELLVHGDTYWYLVERCQCLGLFPHVRAWKCYDMLKIWVKYLHIDPSNSYLILPPNTRKHSSQRLLLISPIRLMVAELLTLSHSVYHFLNARILGG